MHGIKLLCERFDNGGANRGLIAQAALRPASPVVGNDEFPIVDGRGDPCDSLRKRAHP